MYGTGELVKPRSAEFPQGVWAPLDALPEEGLGCTRVNSPNAAAAAGASPSDTVIALPTAPRARLVLLARLLLAAAAAGIGAAFRGATPPSPSYVLEWAGAAG